VGPDDTILAQVDQLLRIDGSPTSSWKAGTREISEYELSPSADSLTNGYDIIVGLHYWEAGERLPVWDEFGQRAVDDAILLGPATLAD
jgi:hypothetical protein